MKKLIAPFLPITWKLPRYAWVTKKFLSLGLNHYLISLLWRTAYLSLRLQLPVAVTPIEGSFLRIRGRWTITSICPVCGKVMMTGYPNQWKGHGEESACSNSYLTSPAFVGRVWLHAFYNKEVIYARLSSFLRCREPMRSVCPRHGTPISRNPRSLLFHVFKFFPNKRP